MSTNQPIKYKQIKFNLFIKTSMILTYIAHNGDEIL